MDKQKGKRFLRQGDEDNYLKWNEDPFVVNLILTYNSSQPIMPLHNMIRHLSDVKSFSFPFTSS